ncbi:alpha/beta hydrolase [Candidatus Pelagibacter sp. Uisw_094]|uniref:hypothetical protein n=1 Tax=Candidatus Pelagibacter sp. Uisw_094 TaxID=3230980 RepID=UPI0039EB5A97
MINLRHINKFLVIVIFSLLLSSQSFADKKFEKDLKKISKDSGFVDNLGKIYPIDDITDKKNTLIVVYNHGSQNDQTLDKCNKKWNKVPPIILNLHDKKINNLKIKILKFCSGVRGWDKNHQDKMDARYKNKKQKEFLNIIKTDGDKIKFEAQKQFVKQKLINQKIDNLINLGFNNIILVGHSAGGWASITLKSQFPKKIGAVIAINPAFSGKFSNRKNWPFWAIIREYGVSQIDIPNLKNTMVYVHDKDEWETSESLSFLNIDNVNFKNISKSNCKAKLIFGKHHGIPLTECFTESDVNKKEMINFLEGIF